MTDVSRFCSWCRKIHPLETNAELISTIPQILSSFFLFFSILRTTKENSKGFALNILNIVVIVLAVLSGGCPVKFKQIEALAIFRGKLLLGSFNGSRKKSARVMLVRIRCSSPDLVNSNRLRVTAEEPVLRSPYIRPCLPPELSRIYVSLRDVISSRNYKINSRREDLCRLPFVRPRCSPLERNLPLSLPQRNMPEERVRNTLGKEEGISLNLDNRPRGARSCALRERCFGTYTSEMRKHLASFER